MLKPLGALLKPVGSSKGQLEASWSALGAMFKPDGVLLGPVLKPLEASCSRLEPKFEKCSRRLSEKQVFEVVVIFKVAPRYEKVRTSYAKP